MTQVQLKVEHRDLATLPQKIRKSGGLPAELYGHGLANTHLSVNQGEFEKLFKKVGESTIIQLLTPDGQMHNVLIHDVQKHYLTNRPIHVDFYEVSMTEELTAYVPLEFTGESAAVESLGGTLVKVLSEVEVECLPMDLPHTIHVNIATLATFADVILVKDLRVSDKVHVLTSADEVVAKVQPPRDIEAELSKPVEQIDVSTVEGVADKQPEAETSAEEKE